MKRTKRKYCYYPFAYPIYIFIHRIFIHIQCISARVLRTDRQRKNNIKYIQMLPQRQSVSFLLFMELNVKYTFAVFGLYTKCEAKKIFCLHLYSIRMVLGCCDSIRLCVINHAEIYSHFRYKINEKYLPFAICFFFSFFLLLWIISCQRNGI